MNKSKIIITLVVALAFTITLSAFFYVQNQTVTPNQELKIFKEEFGNVKVSSPNYDFSPPITMYRALTIGLESDDWNASSLENMTVTTSLNFDYFTQTNNSSGFGPINGVTQPVKNYSDIQVNSTTIERYVWYISRYNRHASYTSICHILC